MSSPYDGAVARLIDSFGRLPGIGPKSAQRIAFHILKASSKEVSDLTEAIEVAKRTVHFCETCFNLAQDKYCSVCKSAKRDRTMVCVVEEPKDMVAIERTGEFHGLYHILQGTISPIDGIGPDQLRISELLQRVVNNNLPEIESDLEKTEFDLTASVNEVIIATNPTVEGDATGMYIARLIEPFGVKVTKLASGLPVGGDLEYADDITLARAFEGRLVYK
ncbi:MAG: recombination protein RecR [Acidimicrobiia bacterium]|nr:recombination protein RecR [Acidimicrobiia bacterium]